MKLIMTCAALLALGGGACSDDGGDEDEEFTDGCDTPHFGGDATDEVWKAMVDAFDQAEVGSADAVTVTTPAAGETLDATTPATLAWTSPIALAPTGRAAHPIATAALSARPALTSPTDWLAAGLGAVADFFVGTAHAHLPPITSDAYYVVITVPGRTCPLRAVTTGETWQPTLTEWKILAAATGPLTMTVTSAYLTENVITEGPYRPATATTFTVE